MNSNLRLHFPPFWFNRKSTAESLTRSNFHYLNNSSMENTFMVPWITLDASKNSPIASRKKIFCSRELPSTDSVKFSKTRGLYHLRKNLYTEGVSKRDSDLITNTRRTGSLKHYELAWDKWFRWCDRREVYPTRCDINYLLDLLAKLFDQDYQYNTTGLHRPASSIITFS